MQPHLTTPTSAQVLMWARRLPDGVDYQPGMVVDGRGQVAAVFDTATGTYEV